MARSQTISIAVDDAQLLAIYNAAPKLVQTTIRTLVEGAAIDVQREMRIVAPVAVTGELRRSIRYTYTPALMQAVIGPTSNYADEVENGGKARWVSVAPGTPLRAWAQQKGLNPYAVQHSIEKKGTKPHPFVEPTFQKMRPVVEDNITSGIASMIEGLTP